MLYVYYVKQHILTGKNKKVYSLHVTAIRFIGKKQLV